MAALRFLAALFALVAVIALVSDLTPSLTGTGPFTPTALETHWQRLSPNSLKAAQLSLSNSLSPAAWRTLQAIALGFPTFAVFGTLAALFGYAGRRRHRVNIYVN